MVGHFPVPFPDESLYSVCARYSQRVRYFRSENISRELFGNKNATAVFDLPGYIANFISALPENNCYSVEQVISELTFLPYYSPFADPAIFAKTKEQMINSKSNGIHARLGIMASRIKMPIFLRYCFICAENDREQYGSFYWHRSHQLPGVHVCWKHKIALSKSNFKLTGTFDLREFIAADRIEIISPPNNFNDLQNDLLFKIALTSHTLLIKNLPPVPKDVLANKYLNLLIERGLVSYGKSIRVKALLEAFINFYTEEFLRFLGCEFRGNDIVDDNWLLRLLRKPKARQHPLYYLLLNIFLNVDTENVFSSPEAENYFGHSPWLCLNPAANHYLKAVVAEFKLGSRIRNGKPIGIFKCKCGFHYARSGPDMQLEDKYRIDKMVCYGKTWESRLTDLWNNKSLNLSEISRLLKVDCLTVKRYAEKLHLSFDRKNKKYKQLRDKDVLKVEHSDTFNERELKRSQWTNVVNKEVGKSLKELRLGNPALYKWLISNDQDWLKSNIPKKEKTIKKGAAFIDWKLRDEELVIKIQIAHKSFLAKKEFPRRITRTSLGKEANCLSLITTKINKLPKTEIKLKTLIETIKTFTLRKIRWVGNDSREKGKKLGKWELINRSGAYRFLKDREIKAALESELNVQI